MAAAALQLSLSSLVGTEGQSILSYSASVVGDMMVSAAAVPGPATDLSVLS